MSAKILVVEDQPLIARQIRVSLEKKGYCVVEGGASAAEAVKAAQDEKPDLIFMDVSLRGEMSGIDAVKQIQQDADIPVIYLTANTDDKTLTEALETDPYAYVLKPFRDSELPIHAMVALHRWELENRNKDGKNYHS